MVTRAFQDSDEEHDEDVRRGLGSHGKYDERADNAEEAVAGCCSSCGARGHKKEVGMTLSMNIRGQQS